MFEVKDKITWSVLTHFLAVCVGSVVILIFTHYEAIKSSKKQEYTQKKLNACRQILASKDAQVVTDLMKITDRTNAIDKRLKIMASLLYRDADTVAEVKWFVQYSKRLEQQGMIGCTYRRNKEGKFRRCKPKFNIADCRIKGEKWICPSSK